MTPRLYLTVLAIVPLVFGLGFILMPTQVLALYGVAANAQVAATAQLLGAAYVGFAVLNWLARTLPEGDRGLRAVLMGNLTSNALGFAVTLINQLTVPGVTNGLIWSSVILYLLFALGAGYLLFMPSARPMASARR
jgi:hypothetical protein